MVKRFLAVIFQPVISDQTNVSKFYSKAVIWIIFGKLMENDVLKSQSKNATQQNLIKQIWSICLFFLLFFRI